MGPYGNQSAPQRGTKSPATTLDAPNSDPNFSPRSIKAQPLSSKNVNRNSSSPDSPRSKFRSEAQVNHQTYQNYHPYNHPNSVHTEPNLPHNIDPFFSNYAKSKPHTRGSSILPVNGVPNNYTPSKFYQAPNDNPSDK